MGDSDAAQLVFCRHHDARDHRCVIRNQRRQRLALRLQPGLIDIRRQIRVPNIENFWSGGKLPTGFELTDAHALAGVVLPGRQYIDVAQVPLLCSQRIVRHVRGEQRDRRAQGCQFTGLQVHHRGGRIAG
ncbi:hypothetical protein D3C86_1783580 [compost metagenome]